MKLNQHPKRRMKMTSRTTLRKLPWRPLALTILLAWFFGTGLLLADINTGLVAYYPFDGNANDYSGNTNHGTVLGAVLTTNRFGNANSAYSFDGATSYIRVPDNDSLELTNDFSISSWIYLRTLAPPSQGILAKHIAGPNNAGSWIYQITPNNGLVDFEATPFFDGSVESTTGLTLNHWHHLIFSYTKSTQIWKYYIDGILDKNGTRSYDIRNTSLDLTIGAEEHPSYPQLISHLDGIIDDIRIYNRVLSLNEVQTLFVTGNLQSPTNQTVFLGANVTFNVSLNDQPPFFYQWFFNGTNIMVGQTNASLTLTNVTLSQAGNYSATISNNFTLFVSSNAYLVVLDTRTPLGDGIPNWWKLQYGLSLTNVTIATNYPTGDQLTYFQKYIYGLNPLTNNTDGDGLIDYDEIFIYHTNPLLADTDGDGIPDGWEVQHGLNPLVNDATQIGSAGVFNLQIYQYDQSHTNQLDPHNLFFAPGTSAYELLNNGQHTNRYYYDHEDRLLGVEFSRGAAIAYNYDGNGNIVRQTVLSRANETNGLPVLWQFLNGLTNSANSSPYADPDGDGWSNYQEWLAGSDPNSSQSTPNLLGNPGTNIAALVFPFTPSNCVVAAGQLDGLGAEELVVSADGNPGTNKNFLIVMTQAAVGWST